MPLLDPTDVPGATDADLERAQSIVAAEQNRRRQIAEAPAKIARAVYDALLLGVSREVILEAVDSVHIPEVTVELDDGDPPTAPAPPAEGGGE